MSDLKHFGMLYVINWRVTKANAADSLLSSQTGENIGSGPSPFSQSEKRTVNTAMPLLFLERFPWPSLQTYTALSAALLAGSIFSAYTIVTDPGFGALETEEPAVPSELELEHLTNDLSNKELATTVLWYLVTDSLFVWVSFTYWNTFSMSWWCKESKWFECMLCAPLGFSQHFLLLIDVDC